MHEFSFYTYRQTSVGRHRRRHSRPKQVSRSPKEPDKTTLFSQTGGSLAPRRFAGAVDQADALPTEDTQGWRGRRLPRRGGLGRVGFRCPGVPPNAVLCCVTPDPLRGAVSRVRPNRTPRTRFEVE